MTIDHLALLRAECEHVGRLARVLDHDARVPHLAPWTVHDVLAHLTGDFLWVLGTLATRRRPTTGLVAVETRGTALCDEWDAVAARLVDALTGLDPDEPCGNFAQGDAGRVGFHVRHQAFETTIHRWDVEAVTGDHAPIDADVAVDAIDELFETYTVRYSPHVIAAPVVVGCTDAPAAWRIAPNTRDGFVTVDRCDRDGDLPDVEADAAVLLLLLWQRIAPEDGRITYRIDPAAVRAFLEGPLTA